MSSDKANFYRKKLDELYAIILGLRPSSPAEEFEAFASRFTTDCIVYLTSMRNNPGISRQEAIEDMKEVLENYYTEKREVLHFSLDSDGRTLFCETKQRLNVIGDTIEEFFETEVVTFDDQGLIKVFKKYCCWSPIVDIVQKKTGKGPYDEGELREQYESHMIQKAMTRARKRQARNDVGNAALLQNGVSAGCCA